MRKKLSLKFKAFRLFLVGVSSFSLSMAGAAMEADAVAQTASSPLLSQTQNAQTNVSTLAQALRAAAGGALTSQNANAALSQVLTDNPGLSMDTLVSAVNQMGLNENTLSEAVSTIGESFGVSEAEVVSALIADTYTNGGQEAADEQIAELRTALGDDIVNEAMQNTDLAELENTPDSQNPENLAGIVTAAGENSGDTDEDEGTLSVYNG